jgi:alanine racemase
MRRFVPIVGVVNMDQVSIDLTDVVDSTADGLAVGTRVELVSPDRDAPNHLPRVAAAAGTIPHELLCRIGPGVRRTYLSEGGLERTTLIAPPIVAAG